MSFSRVVFGCVRVVVVALAVLLFTPAFTNKAVAQQPSVEEDTIFMAVINSASPYFYPSLFLRMQADDNTLTERDYFYLYYGFAYQEAYRPLETIVEEAEFLSIFDRGENISLNDAFRAVELGEKVLERDPFSPRIINVMAFVYGELLGQQEKSVLYMDRLDKVLKAIDMSGDGMKQNTPKHILWFTHANDFLAAQGLEAQKRVIRTRKVEYITIKDNKDKIKGYFFDFSRVYWKKPDVIPKRERRVSGFQINGIDVGQRKDLYTPSR